MTKLSHRWLKSSNFHCTLRDAFSRLDGGSSTLCKVEAGFGRLLPRMMSRRGKLFREFLGIVGRTDGKAVHQGWGQEANADDELQ